MQRLARTWSYAPLTFLAGVLGCSAGAAPPYADLTLRDALGADPAVIADLPPDQRSAIADRFASQSATDAPSADVPLAGPATPQEALRAMDDARRAAGSDALVLAQLAPHDGTLGATPLEVPGSLADTPAPCGLPPLEGEPATTKTRDAESRALGGEAGCIVASAMHAAGATRLVRVTQWPAGLAVVGQVAYVNAAWLVAMASREHGDAGPARFPVLGAPMVPPLTIRNDLLHGSPFATYPTLAACVADLTSRCDACLSGGGCDDTSMLTDFTSAQDECAYLVGDGGSQQSIEEVCVLALTSIATVSQCVEDDGCTVPASNENSVAGLSSAASFLADDTCVRSLNLCLSGQNEPADGGTLNVDVDVQGCLGPFDACSSAFKALGDACSAGKCSGHGGPSCSSCSGCATCSSCKANTRTGTGTGYGSAGTGQNPHQGGSSGESSSGSASSSGEGSSSGSGSGSGSSSGASGSGSGSGGSGSGGSSTSSGSGSSGSGSSSSSGSSGGASAPGGGCSGGCTGGGSGGGGGSSSSCSPA
ncbi:MAG TPA: hypothetical protein VIY73_16140, partial [Polyangiaceae bacterium]